MVDSADDKGHWCADLFAPTYTHDDVLAVSTDECGTRGGLPKHYYADVYEQVVLEQRVKQHAHDDRTKAKKIVQEILNEAEQQQQQQPQQQQESSDNAHTTALGTNPLHTDHLWSGEELSVFREAYVKLKEKAVKLLCVIETKNLKISEMKKENVALKKQLKQRDQLVVDLAKEKSILQGYAKSHEKICNDVEKKLQFYEDCNNDLKDVVVRRQDEIKQLKSKLRNERDHRKQSEASLQERDNEHKVALISIEESLKAHHNREIQVFRDEIEELERTKQIVEEQCAQFKSSFLSLQQHFMHGSVSSTPHGHVSVKGNKKEFIGVADMD